jgi:phosphotransferase system enzyme I (PtsI)
VVLEPRRVAFVRRLVHRVEIDDEISRFESAVASASEELRRDHGPGSVAHIAGEGSILEAYSLMLTDPMLADEVKRHVRDGRFCAEWAVSQAIGDFAKRLSEQTDSYLRERSHDIEFVGDCLLRALVGSGATPQLPPLSGPSIIVASDIFPADLLALSKGMLEGLVTEKGSRTTHAALLARALDLPAVFGVSGLLEQVFSGDKVLLDGSRGTITARPSSSAIEDARSRVESRRQLAQKLRGDVLREAALRSGEAIEILANIERASDIALVTGSGGQGIGLFRTEFLFIDRPSLPCEEEQYECYRSIVESMPGSPVVFRSLDIGGDKPLDSMAIPREPNPALGLRAVRFALNHPEIFKVQLRAILRASSAAVRAGDVRVLVPMVSSLREWGRVRALFRSAIEEVDAAGHRRADEIPLGMMIEVPSAAILADLLVRQCSFVSVGTNDLIQFTLAADRTSPELAELASHFDPSIFRLLRGVSQASTNASKHASVCGAMASEPLGALALIGLGFRCLSMESSAIPRIKETLARVDLRELEATCADALLCSTADEVEHTFVDAFGARLDDLLAG